MSSRTNDRDRFLHRVTQILFAVQAREAPRLPTGLIPNPLVRSLFRSLPAHDQRHLLAVYKACAAEKLPRHILQGALLHDIGKVRLSGTGISVPGRTWHVLFGRFCPTIEARLSRMRIPVISNELYLAVHHAEIGAARLAALGEPDDVCTVVLNHDTTEMQERDMARFQEIDSATP